MGGNRGEQQAKAQTEKPSDGSGVDKQPTENVVASQAESKAGDQVADASAEKADGKDSEAVNLLAKDPKAGPAQPKNNAASKKKADAVLKKLQKFS